MLKTPNEINHCLSNSVWCIKQHQMVRIGDNNQLRTRNLTIETLRIPQRNVDILLSPDNQRWLSSYSDIASDSIHVIGNQQANMLEENFLAQLAVPRSDIIVDNSFEVFNISNSSR